MTDPIAQAPMKAEYDAENDQIVLHLSARDFNTLDCLMTNGVFALKDDRMTAWHNELAGVVQVALDAAPEDKKLDPDQEIAYTLERVLVAALNGFSTDFHDDANRE